MKFIGRNLGHPHFSHVCNIARVKCIILIISLSTKFQMPNFSGLLLIADIYNDMYNQDSLHGPIFRFNVLQGHYFISTVPQIQ